MSKIRWSIQIFIVKNYGCNDILLHNALGEPDDDREELVAAANFACNASCMFLISTLYCIAENYNIDVY